jgi:hypothetical protein
MKAYKFSTDYKKLYNLICEGYKIIVFGLSEYEQEITKKPHDISCKRMDICIRHGVNEITIFRSKSSNERNYYVSRGDNIPEYTELQIFEARCHECLIEFIEPNNL